MQKYHTVEIGSYVIAYLFWHEILKLNLRLILDEKFQATHAQFYVIELKFKVATINLQFEMSNTDAILMSSLSSLWLHSNFCTIPR